MVYILMSNQCVAILGVFDDLDIAMEAAAAIYDGCQIECRSATNYRVTIRGVLVATIRFYPICTEAVTTRR